MCEKIGLSRSCVTLHTPFLALVSPRKLLFYLFIQFLNHRRLKFINHSVDLKEPPIANKSK